MADGDETVRDRLLAWLTTDPAPRPREPARGRGVVALAIVFLLAGTAAGVLVNLDPWHLFGAWGRLAGSLGACVVLGFGLAVLAQGCAVAMGRKLGLGPAARSALGVRLIAGAAAMTTVSMVLVLAFAGLKLYATRSSVLADHSSGAAASPVTIVADDALPTWDQLVAGLDAGTATERVAAVQVLQDAATSRFEFRDKAYAVVSTYLRERTARTTPCLNGYPDGSVVADQPALAVRSPEVMAALRAWQQLGFADDPLDLRSTDWHIADFSATTLADVNAQSSDFSFSNFRDAVLPDLDFSRSFPAGCRSHLEQSTFVRADLTSADFSDAILDRANFGQACLIGVDLTGASVEGTRFIGAQYDTTTSWPDGFDPVAAGAVFDNCS